MAGIRSARGHHRAAMKAIKASTAAYKAGNKRKASLLSAKAAESLRQFRSFGGGYKKMPTVNKKRKATSRKNPVKPWGSNVGGRKVKMGGKKITPSFRKFTGA